VARLDNSIAIFRGQIEEMLGRMEQTLGSLQGPAGTRTMLHGRELEIRGRARQSMGRVRLGFESMTEMLRRRGGDFVPFSPIVAIGLGLSAIAIFSPGTFTRVWNYLLHRSRMMAREMPQATEYTEQARRTLFGGPATNR